MYAPSRLRATAFPADGVVPKELPREDNALRSALSPKTHCLSRQGSAVQRRPDLCFLGIYGCALKRGRPFQLEAPAAGTCCNERGYLTIPFCSSCRCSVFVVSLKSSLCTTVLWCLVCSVSYFVYFFLTSAIATTRCCLFTSL